MGNHRAKINSVTIAKIEKTISALQRIIKFHGHLDHITRAVEEYIYDEDTRIIRETKNRVREKRAKDPKYVLTETERKILAEYGKNVFYHINKIPSDTYRKGTAMVSFFERGATIIYSSKGTGITDEEILDKGTHMLYHIAIAHELGHVLFHTELNVRERVRELLKSDSAEPEEKKETEAMMENQASYFAERVINERAGQFTNSGFIKDHLFSDTEIRNAILSVEPKYDSGKIPK